MVFKVKTLSTLTLVAKNLYLLQMQYSVAKSETALGVPKATVCLRVCVCRTCLTCQNSLAVSAATINWQLIPRAELVNVGTCS